MNYQQAIEHAIALRLRVKNESVSERRQKLLDLACEWEVWAEHCREHTAKGEAIELVGKPQDDI